MTQAELRTQDEVWAPFRRFLGNWSGSGEGKSGKSTVERSYSLILADQFIQIKNRSVFPPQPANPSGEIHEDMGFLSYDKGRSLYVLREFFVEGYVNRSILQTSAQGDPELVFLTESIENLSPGWNARTTIKLTSPDTFDETFDLAGPGKDWACMIRLQFHRA